ncbi:hypothetical protein BHM03_00052953, partial [Ensete ventricosum]
LPNLWVKSYGENNSEEGLRANIDLVEERRTKAYLLALAYMNVIARLYNRKGKLAPSWEGPYRVINVISDGTYHLATQERVRLPRTWHVFNLKKFYI